MKVSWDVRMLLRGCEEGWRSAGEYERESRIDGVGREMYRSFSTSTCTRLAGLSCVKEGKRRSSTWESCSKGGKWTPKRIKSP